jgi:hypothetical protein
MIACAAQPARIAGAEHRALEPGVDFDQPVARMTDVNLVGIATLATARDRAAMRSSLVYQKLM